MRDDDPLMPDDDPMVRNGDACAVCGVPFLDSGGAGVPRACTRCTPRDFHARPTRVLTVNCPLCARGFRDDFGLAAHRAMTGH